MAVAREPGEHDRDRARRVPGHEAGRDGRTDREEHAVRKAGEDARRDQRLVARRLPGQQIAGGEPCHQAEQQRLTRKLAGERGEHRSADGDAQRVEADQQPGRGQFRCRGRPRRWE
jgi:hypothetical protein